MCTSPENPSTRMATRRLNRTQLPNVIRNMKQRAAHGDVIDMPVYSTSFQSSCVKICQHQRARPLYTYKQLCCRREAARCFVYVSSTNRAQSFIVSTQATDLSLRTIKCCSVVFRDSYLSALRGKNGLAHSSNEIVRRIRGLQLYVQRANSQFRRANSLQCRWNQFSTYNNNDKFQSFYSPTNMCSIASHTCAICGECSVGWFSTAVHYTVAEGEDWAGTQSAQAPPCCTKCNSPPISGQCTNHRIAV